MITANALICGKKIQLIVIKIMSLGYNPIEHKWAQAKSKKRESGCDTEILFSVHMV
ncbi:hypothetical protein [Symbiopectobacterium sp. RP]|uniref:hypothetical protein n=1 Tax=Symbiopectobacterium sp. RP TaxID=3248553 RepID=UPI003D2A7222